MDAPDICASVPASEPPASGFQRPPQSRKNGSMRGASKTAGTPILSADESAAARDRLLGEIASLPSQDSAASWARAALVAKNRLTVADAKRLEDAFEQKIAKFSTAEIAEPPMVDRSSTSAIGSRDRGAHDATTDASNRIDKSVLEVSAPRRYRNKEHLRFVAQQPCLVCARAPSDAHHLRFMQPRALGCKASDEFTVPLCRAHHRAVHRAGDEQAWWTAASDQHVSRITLFFFFFFFRVSVFFFFFFFLTGRYCWPPPTAGHAWFRIPRARPQSHRPAGRA